MARAEALCKSYTFPLILFFFKSPRWWIISLHTRAPFVNATLLWG